HASYLVADPDAGVAFLVDPDRKIETYLSAAARLGVLITDSFETHIHNDYVSGSRALGLLRPITVHAGDGAGFAYPHAAHPDGDEIKVGEIIVRCIATPGHPPEHVAYLVSDLRRAAGFGRLGLVPLGDHRGPSRGAGVLPEGARREQQGRPRGRANAVAVRTGDGAGRGADRPAAPACLRRGPSSRRAQRCRQRFIR